MAWSNSWNFAITCIGTDNKRYYKERFAGGTTGGSDGRWSQWRMNQY